MPSNEPERILVTNMYYYIIYIIVKLYSQVDHANPNDNDTSWEMPEFGKICFF